MQRQSNKMNGTEHLLIVDGHNLLFQMFFGMPNPIINHEGRQIQGVIGFVGALLKIIRQVEPTQMVVIFDGEHENPRKALLPEYKENRMDYSEVAEEENPFSILQDVYRALDVMEIRHYETRDVEADDVIAGYVRAYGNGQRITIASWDSDYFQLISPNVAVLRYRGTGTYLCDLAYLQEKFKIEPNQYADFKALVGDTADNIKGAEKVGPKTAAYLLASYETLEGILVHAAEIAKPSVRKSVQQNVNRLRLNYRLIRLEGVEQLPFSPEELSVANCTTSLEELKTNAVLQEIGLRK